MGVWSTTSFRGSAWCTLRVLGSLWRFLLTPLDTLGLICEKRRTAENCSPRCDLWRFNCRSWSFFVGAESIQSSSHDSAGWSLFFYVNRQKTNLSAFGLTFSKWLRARFCSKSFWGVSKMKQQDHHLLLDDLNTQFNGLQMILGSLHVSDCRGCNILENLCMVWLFLARTGYLLGEQSCWYFQVSNPFGFTSLSVNSVFFSIFFTFDAALIFWNIISPCEKQQT